jgi:hypothetical protein
VANEYMHMHRACEMREQSWRESCEKLEARIAELEAMVVWAVEHHAQLFENPGSIGWHDFNSIDPRLLHEIPIEISDGPIDITTADILRAVREARTK